MNTTPTPDAVNWIFTAFNVLSWGMFAVLIVTTLMLWGRDRFQRRLRLRESGEAQALAELRRSGAVSEGEYRKLNDRCRALPEVEEVAPAPDLPLRLAAAFTRIGAGTVLIWLACRALLLIWGSGVNRGWWGRGAVFQADTAALDGVAGWAVTAAVLGYIAVYAIQFFAAKAWLMGSAGGRWLVIGGWVMSFLLLPNFFQARFWLPVAGIYVVGVALRESRTVKTRIAVAIVAAAALLFGCRNGIDYHEVRTESSFGVGMGGGVTAKLERLVVIAGTPEPVIWQTMEALQDRLRGAGIPVRLVAYGEAATEVDGDREMVLWLARETAPGGFPVYRLRTLCGTRGEMWRGLRLPGMQLNFSGAIKVLSSGDGGVPAKMAREIVGQMLPHWKYFRSPDALELPLRTENPLPPPRDMAGEAGVRHLARIRRGDTGYDVYMLRTADSAGARAKELLSRRGFPDAREGFMSGDAAYFAKPDSAMALLAIPWDGEDSAVAPEAGWLEREAQEQVVRFVLCDGLNLVDSGEFAKILTRFFAHPDAGILGRMKALSYFPRKGGTDPAVEALLRREYLRLVDDIIAEPSGVYFCLELDRLWSRAEEAPFAGLKPELVRRLGNRYHRLDLAEVPELDGVINVEYEWPVPFLPDSRGVIEITFPDGIYEPVRFWYEVRALGGGKYLVRSTNAWSEMAALSMVQSQVSEDIWYAEPSGQLAARWRSQRERESVVGEPRSCEPGEMATLLFADVDANCYRLVLKFCPGTAETRGYQQRLRRLESGWVPDFEGEYAALLRDTAATAGMDGFLSRLQKVAELVRVEERKEPARRLRREIWTDCYSEAAFPVEPDADGVYRLRREFPLRADGTVQMLWELIPPQPGAVPVLIPFGLVFGEDSEPAWIGPYEVRTPRPADWRKKQWQMTWQPIVFNGHAVGYFMARGSWVAPERLRPAAGTLQTAFRLEPERSVLVLEAAMR